MPVQSFTYRVRPGRPRSGTPAYTTPFLDLAGQKFGCLTAVERINQHGGRSYWSCLCDCGGPGSQIIVRSDKLTAGQTKSCKCGRGYGKSGPKPVPDRQPCAATASTDPATALPAAPAKPKAPTTYGHRIHTPEELAAAELLSARQMVAFRFRWADIAAYLAIGRAGGCTIAEAKQLIAA